MADTTAPPPTIPLDHGHEHPERHEHSDVNVRALAIALVALILIAAAVHIGLYYLLGIYSRQQAAVPINQPRAAVRSARLEPAPGVPRVQGVPGFHEPTPKQDMAALRARNQEILTSYGPAASPGHIRIPIDLAMKISLEQGLFPVREEQPRPSQGEPDGAP